MVRNGSLSYVSFTTIKKKRMNCQQNTQSTDWAEKSDRKEYILYASNWPHTEKFAIPGMLTPEIQ